MHVLKHYRQLPIHLLVEKNSKKLVIKKTLNLKLAIERVEKKCHLLFVNKRVRIIKVSQYNPF